MLSMFNKLFIILSFVSAPLFAQNNGFKVVYAHPKTKTPALLRFEPGSSNRPGAENPAVWIRRNLYASDAFQLRFTKEINGSDGNRHLRYQQYYGRYKVLGGEVTLHEKNQTIYALNGRFYPNLDADTTVRISPETALVKALALFTGSVFMWEIPREEQLLRISAGKNATYYPRAELLLLPTGDSGRNSDFRMAYRLDVYAAYPHVRELIYIDAASGEVLQRENRICSMDHVGIAHTKYAGIREITCDSISEDTFILKDNTRGKGIYTIDVRIIGTDSSRDFTDSDNVWNNVNVYKDEVATDVHWGSAFTYDYFRQYHNRLSYDDSNGMILSKVHVGNKYNNAFWNGTSANYGDGDGTNLSPLTSIDVVAHELTHGVTGNTAGLRYRNESGALNESFSDIFGKTAEYLSDSAGFSWKIARKIALKGSNYFRDMSFPPAKSHPKYYGGRFYYTGTADNGGVHLNSGVQNYWFYLLCNGGSGLREDDSMPFNVEPIGFEKAGQVAYLNLSAYLGTESEYIDAAYLSLDAATALFGESSYELRQVKQAWYAVGLLSKFDLGTEALAASSQRWSVYPNPGNNYLYIRNPHDFNPANVSVTDPSGKTILSASVLPDRPLDVSALAPGVYLIRINGHTVLRWMKS